MGDDDLDGRFSATAGGFFGFTASAAGWHIACSTSLCPLLKEERTQTVDNYSSSKSKLPTDPVSLGELCQAMFIEGARVLGFTGEAPMPREVQEQVFLAATLVADGLGLLLQNEDDDEQELAG